LNIVAIILARGGSKGIPKKNIIDFCGKPLIEWTINQCIEGGSRSVWVSSDSMEILDIALKCGANSILRPDDLSQDVSTSESAWLHALNYIEKEIDQKIDWILAPQITSPIRESSDITKAIKLVENSKFDSLFSSSIVEDLFFWQYQNNKLCSVNYDYRNRKRRQDAPKQIVENGSFYLFKPQVLKKYNNRFGLNIGKIEMELWKMFEIDSLEDLELCKTIFKNFILKKNPELYGP
jgi:N-acylneuraminate cytidylyltransferase